MMIQTEPRVNPEFRGAPGFRLRPEPSALRDRDLLARVDEGHLGDRPGARAPLCLDVDGGPELRELARQPAVADVPLQPRRVDGGRDLSDAVAPALRGPLHVVERRERVAVDLHARDLAADA